MSDFIVTCLHYGGALIDDPYLHMLVRKVWQISKLTKTISHCVNSNNAKNTINTQEPVEDEGSHGGQADIIEELQVGVADLSDLEDLEDELDSSGSDSELDAIPIEDDSDVDEELKSFRQERRTKKLRRDKLRHEIKTNKQKEKPIINEDIPLGEAGVDRGFEDYGNDKANKYAGKLEDLMDVS
ncbi:hypothetical protein A4A49_61036 [Nicotiana attenuata]|uniref:Uncharacterized protein n=1 Tax=Nicotiana attenuata TaxID=49451 RepID=A0A1J6KJX6_NICAT|nr:hypothetical protein A4A49_42317 [Nicotiana attenuata]OIT19719.1 hypothetical protein A4A49_61036 [Nicotiana attenuata]